jgi:hypothetical protein
MPVALQKPPKDPVQEQLHLLPHEGTFAEFNERIIQFGYLVLFAPAYPLPGPSRGVEAPLAFAIVDRFLYGAFVWACRALNSQKWRFPARAGRHFWHLSTTLSRSARPG